MQQTTCRRVSAVTRASRGDIVETRHTKILSPFYTYNNCDMFRPPGPDLMAFVLGKRHTSHKDGIARCVPTRRPGRWAVRENTEWTPVKTLIKNGQH
ncbi:hypothetical protein EVAR_92571_1 [Eumeta japonica]|uniref:Uncharacterized protein n=1 Tax=Eumeta variegata TaxID=151549 RepID=A0A4C1SZZ4_EUMVA|nr:hypothetical protein EVAR_92571_1 [Eumeta japonica]